MSDTIYLVTRGHYSDYHVDSPCVQCERYWARIAARHRANGEATAGS